MIPTGQVGHFKKSQNQNLKQRKKNLFNLKEKISENLQREYLHDFYINEKR